MGRGDERSGEEIEGGGRDGGGGVGEKMEGGGRSEEMEGGGRGVF